MKKVIYGWSFDPLTYGHDDVVRRSAKHFDHLTVGIGVNADKEGRYLFSLQERLHLVREALKDLLNVDVVAYRGMTTDYAKENEYDLLIRWLRNGNDFDAEQSLERAFKRQEKNTIETFFLNAKQSMQDLSSSAAKAVLKEQWDIREYVPMIIKQAMEGRLLWQYFAGITGSVGSWKSFTTEQFIKLCEKNGIPAHHLDLDKIGHEIQWPLQEPIYQTARQKIIQMFGNDVANEDGSINRKHLGPKVFSDPKHMGILNDIMREPMQLRTKRLMYNQKWLFFYNAALIAEAGSSSIVNNNVVLVNVARDIQAERLQNRWLSGEETEKRLSSQFTTEHKRNLLSESIDHDGHGKIIELQSPYSEQEASVVFNKLLAQLDTFGELRFLWLMNRLWVKEDPKKLFVQLRDIYDRPISSDARWDDIAQKMKWSYHKRLHAIDCSNELYQIKHLLQDPDVVECALIFHDIVYDPISKTNEEDSAHLAEQLLTQWWLPKDFIEKVKDLILATRHRDLSKDNDTQYIMDIDKAVLGKNFREYTQYTKDIRREYYMYSDTEFTMWRKQFLMWLDKKNIYDTVYFKTTYGQQAEKNISDELDHIEKSLG